VRTFIASAWPLRLSRATDGSAFVPIIIKTFRAKKTIGTRCLAVHQSQLGSRRKFFMASIANDHGIGLLFCKFDVIV
jgi:hypothetical protein